MPFLLYSTDSLTLNEILTLIISASSLLVSLVTLCLGWVAYNRFLSQKLGENQLTVVLDFVQAIYQSDFSMWVETRKDGGVVGHRSSGNLFQLSKGKSTQQQDLHDEFYVFTPSVHSLNFKGWDFLQNPLLPNAISKELYAFRKSFQTASTTLESTKAYIILGEIKEGDDNAVAEVEFKGGYKAFIEHCTALDLAIQSWLEKHGLHDLNQHVVNTSPFNYYTKQKYYEVDKADYEKYQAAMKILADAVRQFS